MADANVGNITASLRVDSTNWQQGLRQAEQQLQQFAGQIASLTSQLTQFSQAFQQAFTQSQQGLAVLPQRAQQANQSFSQFNQTLNVTRNTFVSVQQSAQTFNTSIAQTTNNVTQARQAMQGAHQATSSFAQVLQVASGIGLATSVQGMISAVVSFGREVVQTGTRLESLRASLGAIAGSSAAGQSQFQFLTATARQLGVELQPLAQGWRTFTAAATAANLPMGDQQRLLIAITREAQRTGVSAQGLERGLLALAQSASKGRVSMEEIRQQLGEQFPTAFKAMADGLGRTTAELEKLIETGAVSFPQMARGLTRGWEQMQQGAGQMVQTSQQAFARLQTALTSFKDELAQNILPEMQRLAGWATRILETAKDLLRTTGGRAGTGAQGPTLEDLGASDVQQKELDRLNRVIQTLEARGGAGTPVMQEHVRTQIANAKELRDQVLQAMRTTTDQAGAQEKVTLETNKTTASLQLQTEFLEQITQKQADVLKARQQFREEARLSPERLGRPGTPEFLAGEQRALEKPLSELTALAMAPPAGVTLPAQQRQEILALDTTLGQLGRTKDALIQKDRESTRVAREALQEQKRAARELDEQLKGERRERIEAIDLFGVVLSPEQESDLKEQAREQRQRIQAFAREGDLLGLELPPEVERQRRAVGAFDLRLRQQIEQQQLSRVERPEAKMRGEMEAQGIPMTAAREREFARWQALREQQERLNTATQIWGDLSQGVGSAWVSALESVASGTKTVSEAFRAMGASIMKTMSDIAAQQATQAFFKLGMKLLTAVISPTITPAAAGASAQEAAAGTTSFPAGAFFGGLEGYQHGGVIKAPTLAMLGEGPSSTLPEYVMNQSQMNALLSRGAQGGQGSPVSIHNYPDKASAEQGAAQAKANGEQTILNVIQSNLNLGESSSLLRTLRSLQR